MLACESHLNAFGCISETNRSTKLNSPCLLQFQAPESSLLTIQAYTVELKESERMHPSSRGR